MVKVSNFELWVGDKNWHTSSQNYYPISVIALQEEMGVGVAFHKDK